MVKRLQYTRSTHTRTFAFLLVSAFSAALTAPFAPGGEEPARQPAFAYGFSGCGDLRSVPGSVYRASIDCVLETTENASDIGAESWSFCVESRGAVIRAISIEGTDAEGLMDTGFEVQEVVNEGRGAISAVILSYRNPGTLPPLGISSVASITIEGIIPAGEDENVLLSYIDGLSGSGRPVESIVTYDGETVLPELGTCSFTVSPDRTPPAPPSGLSTVAGDGFVELSWLENEEDDLAGYRLYRNGELIVSGLEETSYRDETVDNGTAYSYTVAAIDTSGNESSPSAPAGASPEDRTPPAAPTGLLAEGSPGLVDLNWDDNTEDDLAGYNLYRDGELLVENLAESSYSDTAVSEGETYTYTVTALDHNANESTPSLSIEATPQLPPVGPFVRGDTNNDTRVDIADAIWGLSYLFSGGPPPGCAAAADSNGDGRINVADPIYSLNWLFGGGQLSPAPNSCGSSSSEGDLILGCKQLACPN